MYNGNWLSGLVKQYFSDLYNRAENSINNIFIWASGWDLQSKPAK